MPDESNLTKLDSMDRPSRLEPLTERGLLPWRKAQNAINCHLYWMPCGGPTMPYAQRQWMLRFAAKLRSRVIAETNTMAHLFLQMKVVYPDLADTFIRYSPRFTPMTGLSRRRGAALPALPDEEYIERLKAGKQTYDHKAIQPDYCYWFLAEEVEEQSNLFFGYGGLMTFFSKPQAGTSQPLPAIPPGVAKHPGFAPLLANNQLEKARNSLMRMSSPFFPQSKTIFGRGLEEELQYPGLKFVVPLFAAQDFLEAKPGEVEEWFTLFDVVFTESPHDKGVLLASRQDLDLDDMLTELLTEMDNEGDKYPEYA